MCQMIIIIIMSAAIQQRENDNNESEIIAKFDSKNGYENEMSRLNQLNAAISTNCSSISMSEPWIHKKNKKTTTKTKKADKKSKMFAKRSLKLLNDHIFDGEKNEDENKMGIKNKWKYTDVRQAKVLWFIISAGNT